MKMTKRIAAIAACAVMAVTSMVGMSASAATDDHGNTMATATTFTGNITGKIETAGDVDFFKYTATTNGIKYFCTTGNDSIITVYNASGTSIGSSMNTYGGKKMAGANLTKGSTYYISVRENGSNYGTSYTLSQKSYLEVGHLSQADPKWNSQIMKGNINLNETIQSSGCAITSCAMVINYLKNKSITPVTLNSSTYLDTKNGAKWGTIASAYYLHDSDYFYTESEALGYLQKGYPVIVHISTGHYLVAVGYENGKLMVVDAGKTSSAVVAWNKNYTTASINKYRVFY